MTTTICCAGKSAALDHACRYLKEQGFHTAAAPDWQTRHLLLDVPSFRPGLWTQTETETLLSSLHPDVTIWGGYLSDYIREQYHTIDLLEDEEYLIRNAAITADCAMPILEAPLNLPWRECPSLIIGWGRIGKALASRLKQAGCPVTVASTRDENQRPIQEAGYGYVHQNNILPEINRYRAIINTAPTPMLDEDTLSRCVNCVKLDLASVKGLGGSDVIWARALPGRLAPEASGRLIAQTFLRLWKEDTI